MEWMFGLIIVLVVLLLLIAIGHLAWILLARLFGYRVRTWRASTFKFADRYCPRCGGRSVTGNGPCGLCGWSRAEPAAVDPLAVTTEQLRAFAHSQLIDAETYDRVMGAIAAERKRTTVQPPPLPVQPMPVMPLEAAAPSEPIAPQVEHLPPFIAAVHPPEAQSLPAAATVPPPLPQEPHAPAVAPQVQRPPHRPLSEVFASFMEENNIRWGELVGGLLVVGCSVALVVSFWADITRRPWLQFSVFTAVTAAFFGLGLYTEHRWKLPLTSRGVLLIATLLVPLNFLAFAALSSGGLPGPLTLGAEVVAFALFTYLVWQSAKVIAPVWPEILTVGTCAMSACLLVLGCLGIDRAEGSRLTILAIVPLAAYVLPTGWMLARARRWRTIHAHGAHAIYLLLGVFTFAAVLALGVLIYRSPSVPAALRQVAMPLSFGGLPALATGMLLWRRITSGTLSTARTLGTAVAIAGAIVLLSGIAAAWPNPDGMLSVAVCDFVALTVVAFLYDVPAGHWLALPCAILSWLLAFHLHRGVISFRTVGEDLIGALLSVSSGAALTPMALLIGAAWTGLKRWRAAHARVYGAIAIIIAAASIALVNSAGIARCPAYATWIYALYAVAAFGLAWRSHPRTASPAAWALLTAALIQGFVGYHLTPTPWTSALIIAATCAALAVAVTSLNDRESLHRIVAPAKWLAAIAPLVAVAIVASRFSSITAGRDSVHVCWAAGILLFVAAIEGTALLFIIGEAVLAGGIVLAVISRLALESWFVEVRRPLLHPWTVQTIAVALAIYCLGWKVLRNALARVGRALPAVSSDAVESATAPAHDRVVTPRPVHLLRFNTLLAKSHVFDRELSAILLLVALGLAMFAVFPAALAELSRIGSTNVSGVHQQAAGIGSWLLIAVLVLIFLAALWETLKPAFLIALLITIWIACPLLASGSTSPASALRWLFAGYFLVCTIPLWLRFVLRPMLPRAFYASGRASRLLFVARATLVALAIAPVLLFTAWPMVDWLLGDGMPGLAGIFATVGLPLNYALPVIVLAMVMVGDAVTERSQLRAFAASLLLCGAGVVFYLLRIAITQQVPNGPELLGLYQIVSLVLSFFAAGWLVLRECLRMVGRDPGGLPAMLKAQVGIALALNAIVLLPAAVCLALAPTWAAGFVGVAGGSWAMGALLAAVGAGVFTGMLRRDRLTVRDLTMASLLLAAMMGLTSAHLWPTLGWRAFHAMLAADVVAAWGLLGFGWWIVRREQASLAPSPLCSVERAGVRGYIGTGADVMHDGGLSPMVTVSDATSPSPITPTLSPEYPSTALRAGGGEGAKGVAPPTLLEYQSPDAISELPVYFGGQNVQTASTGAATAVSILVIVLAIRALMGDPAAPWWSMAAAGAIALLFVAIACWARRPRALYPAGLLLNFAAATFYLWRGWSASWSVIDFLSIQAIAAAIPGVAWLVLELQVFRKGRPIAGRFAPVLHHVSAIAATVLSLLAVGWIVSRQMGDRTLGCEPTLVALALACTAALLLACLWDSRAHYVAACGYGLGLGAAALAVCMSEISLHWLPWALAMNLACYALLTSFIFAHHDRLTATLRRFGSEVPDMHGSSWLAPANIILALIVLAAPAVADFSLEPFSARLIIATAAVAQTMTLELLVGRARWSIIRHATLTTFACGVVLWAWAWLPIGEGLSLNRSGVTFIAIALLTYTIGLLFPRRLGPQSQWLYPARSTGGMLLIPAIVSLAATLILETLTRMENATLRWHRLALAVLVTLVGACVLAVESALRPGDPPRFSDRTRKGFIYAAEVLLALAFFHLRMSEPQLFAGFLRPYWPLVIMAIAFAGVGVAEVFRRQGRPILSEPLERTGIFLPLLPVIGWWLAPAAGIGFGPVLLVVAAFYAVVGAMRRSLALAGVAALAANGALWDALAHSSNLGFFQHPQLWLIPASLCLLAGTQLNRERLKPESLRALRYMSLVLIYVSSTADVFLNGVERTPWLPLILVALSVAGVFIGVLFRIRAFLLLGTSFLFLSIVTMIWFAASAFHWTWIWYVAGILLGTGILAIFALFEKKKEQMLALIEGFKRWE